MTAAVRPTTGYWTATADGRVLPFGSAQSLGSMAGTALSGAIVGMAPTSSGQGLLAARLRRRGLLLR